MALVECPECGHKVSDKAISCPGCGYPLAEDRPHSARRDFPFLTPLGELAAMVEGLAGALREALHPERGQRPGDEEKGKERPKEPGNS